MTNTHNKKLIEVALPLQAVNAASAHEKSIRQGHPSTMHIWWARRPLAIMRAAIFASLVSAPNDNNEIEKLLELIADTSNWDQVNVDDNRKIEEIQQIIRKHFPEKAPRILDPFMGGGSTGLEALRLGCDTYAVEINPVAHLVELCTLLYPQKYKQLGTNNSELGNEIRKWGKWIFNQVQDEIGYLYENPIGDEKIVGYLWARTIKCSNSVCGAVIPLVRNWWLVNKAKRNIVLQPIVQPNSNKITFKIVDTELSTVSFDPSQGTFSRGEVTCPVCNNTVYNQTLNQEAQAGNMGEMPLAVIYQDQNKLRGYRPVGEEDIALFRKAQTALNSYESELPDEEVGEELGIRRYGIFRWRDFFNARQAIALVVFSRNVQSAHKQMLSEGMEFEKAKIITTYLGLSLDYVASNTSTLCRWIERQESISNIFTYPEFWMQWSFAEANPIGLNNPWSRAITRIANLTKQLDLATDQMIFVDQGTALDLKYPDNFFDAIITDPPYYGNVDYANLSDFFYVWLKRSIGFLYPNIFTTTLTSKENQIFQKTRTAVDESSSYFNYEQMLSKALREIERTLKNDGILTLIYPFQSKAVLEIILDLLLKAGFIVTATWPIRTERNLLIQTSTEDTASLLIVCKKNTMESKQADFLRFRATLRHRIRQRLESFQDMKIPLSDYFLSAIGPGIALLGEYEIVKSEENDPVQLTEVIDIIRDEVVEFALVQEYLKKHGTLH